jgi:hypothetical protein
MGLALVEESVSKHVVTPTIRKHTHFWQPKIIENKLFLTVIRLSAENKANFFAAAIENNLFSAVK